MRTILLSLIFSNALILSIGMLVIETYNDNWFFAFIIISCVATHLILKDYKTNIPDEYKQFKDTLARIGKGASYSIHR